MNWTDKVASCDGIDPAATDRSIVAPCCNSRGFSSNTVSAHGMTVLSHRRRSCDRTRAVGARCCGQRIERKIGEGTRQPPRPTPSTTMGDGWWVGSRGGGSLPTNHHQSRTPRSPCAFPCHGKLCFFGNKDSCRVFELVDGSSFDDDKLPHFDNQDFISSQVGVVMMFCMTVN